MLEPLTFCLTQLLQALGDVHAQVLDFIPSVGKNALPKNVAESVKKRLVAEACTLQDDDEHIGRGRPRKMAKIRDLKRVYPEWK